MSPEILPLDEHSSLPISTPPAVTYSTYPPAISYFQNDYHTSSPFHSTPQNYFYEYQYPNDHSQSLPPTLPSMLPSNYPSKQEMVYEEDDLMNPFSMNYASLAGLEVPSSQAYTASPDSQAQVNTTTFFPRSRTIARF